MDNSVGSQLGTATLSAHIEQSGKSQLTNVGRAAEPHPYELTQGALRAEIPTLAPVARSYVAATQSLSHNRHIH